MRLLLGVVARKQSGGGSSRDGSKKASAKKAWSNVFNGTVKYLQDMPIDDLVKIMEILEPVQFNRVVTSTATKDQLLAFTSEPNGPPCVEGVGFCVSPDTPRGKVALRALQAVLFVATSITPDTKIEHRDKQLQFQLLSVEHARKGYPLRTSSLADCIELAKKQFGTAPCPVPFSMHFTPDKSQQYIICEGSVSMLPPSTTNQTYEAFTAPDGRIYISDGVVSFYPSDVLEATREADLSVTRVARLGCPYRGAYGSRLISRKAGSFRSSGFR